MADPMINNQVDGECQVCGFPGIIGLTCSECGGPIVGYTDLKSPDKLKQEPERYNEEDLLAEPTESLEELAEQEDKEDIATHEDL